MRSMSRDAIDAAKHLRQEMYVNAGEIQTYLAVAPPDGAEPLERGELEGRERVVHVARHERVQIPFRRANDGDLFSSLFTNKARFYHYIFVF